MRLTSAILLTVATAAAEPLPIDDLWKSESFQKAVTGSFGIDSRIEPRITTDEEFYLDEAAQKMADDDREAAIATLTESSLLAESPAMLFTLATHQLESEEQESAIESYERAIDLYPNFRDAHRNLAIVFVQQERFDDAKNHLVRAIELGSREGLTAGLLGYCHAIAGNFRAANEAYRLATLTQPDNRQWIEGLAQSFAALNRSADSADLYQQLLDDKPSEIRPWLAQADAFVNLDQANAAMANMEFAHRAGELNPTGLVSLGHLYLREDLVALAVARYEKALSGQPSIPITKGVEIVEQLTARQNWNDAKKLNELVGELDTESAESPVLSRLNRTRALIELEIGDPAKGAELIEDWLTREPADGLAILLLARFRQTEGKREEAEMLLERAARDPEHAAAAHLAHARLLVGEGEYEEAVQHLETAYNINPKQSVLEYTEAVRELVD